MRLILATALTLTALGTATSFAEECRTVTAAPNVWVSACTDDTPCAGVESQLVIVHQGPNTFCAG